MNSTDVPRSRAFAQQRQHLRLHRHVERGRGFVGNQQAGIAGEGHRDQHALPQSAAELERMAAQHPPRVLHLHLGQQFFGARPSIDLRNVLVPTDHLRDLPADGHGGVQRRHRLLKHHRGKPPAPICEVGLRRRQHVVAEQQDAAAADAHRRARDQAQHRHRRHRLAEAGFADKPDDLAGAHRQRHAAQCRHHAMPCRERQRQIFDRQHRRQAHRPRCRGSRMSRKPSPSRLKPMAVTRMATPGNVGYHH
jgi:hypothetical protein